MTQPSEPNDPIRTCIGCRQRFPQTRLVRLVLDPAGTVRVDRRGAGRGAWLCGPGCLEPARRRRAFDRAFRSTLSPNATEHVAGELSGSTD